MKISKNIRRNKKINISEKSKVTRDSRITTFGSGLLGSFLRKPELQVV